MKRAKAEAGGHPSRREALGGNLELPTAYRANCVAGLSGLTAATSQSGMQLGIIALAMGCATCGALGSPRIECCRASEPAASTSLKLSCSLLIAELSSERSRRPPASELKEIEEARVAKRFGGGIGCANCSGWEWKSRLAAWKREFCNAWIYR